MLKKKKKNQKILAYYFIYTLSIYKKGKNT